MKLVVGLISGSVSIISEAIHSMMDLAAAVVAFFSIRLADRPADDDHPYGHEKIENISGVIEALLIFLASALIIFKSVKKIISGEPIGAIGLGFVVMLISALVNLIVSHHLYKVAEREDSIALKADALHLRVDVYTSAGVALGLFVLWLTGLNFLDPVIAIAIALFILKEALEMLIHAFKPLVDSSLTDEEIEGIKNILKKYKRKYSDTHEIRTRRSGKVRHIDFHMTVDPDMTVRESHKLCDKIEKEIQKKFKHTKVIIHVEDRKD